MSDVPHPQVGAVENPDVAVDSQRVHVVYARGAAGVEYATSCR